MLYWGRVYNKEVNETCPCMNTAARNAARNLKRSCASRKRIRASPARSAGQSAPIRRSPYQPPSAGLHQMAADTRPARPAARAGGSPERDEPCPAVRRIETGK